MSPLSRTLESYRNVLVPVPEAGPGVCRTCWRDTRGHTRCNKCQEHLAESPELLADVVVPIALAVNGRQFAHELRNYKDGFSEHLRRQLRNRLANVLAEFLRRHEGCLADAVQAPGFGLVTSIPSTSGRIGHPLAHMLGYSIMRTRTRFVDILEPLPEAPADRGLRPDRFRVNADIAGKNVLLVDDTWTTGARMQSASARLKLAGAAKVAGLVMGRWFTADYPPSRDYLAQAEAAPFDWARCCLDRSVPGMSP
jgi:predicted amidophosphoribosyltransferase